MKAITNSELPEVRDLIVRLNGVPNIKLAYATAKSVIRIDQEIRDLLEIRKEDPDYIKYSNLLEDIKRKHAIKRPDGQENYQKILAEPIRVPFHRVEHSEIKPLLEKNPDGKTTISGAQFVGLALLLKSPVTMDMVPEDITAPDMKILIEHFGV